MKVFALLCVGAAAVAPPRIELDLPVLSAKSATLSSLTTPLVAPAYDHDNNAMQQPDGTGVMSRQDWTERCPADAALNDQKQDANHACPHPVANAYDHNDKAVEVTTRIYLVNFDGMRNANDELIAPGGAELPIKVDKVDYSYRATYLFKFDAQDSAGNHAEQVVFVLMLDDTTPPDVHPCNCDKNGWCNPADPDVLRAATEDKFCKGSKAGDNCWQKQDGTYTCMDNKEDQRNTAAATATIRYTITRCPDDASDPPQAKTIAGENRCVEGGQLIAKDATYEIASAELDTKYVGTYEIVVKAWDSAGAYGSGCGDRESGNNCRERRKLVKITDRVRPQITINGALTVVHECATPYSDASAVVFDNLDTDKLGKTITVEARSNVDENTITTPEDVSDYKVIYNARDAAHNAAPTQTRTVVVQDTTDPVIKMNPAPCSEEVCEFTDMQYRVTDPGAPGHVEFVDPGASVSDTCDLDITARVGKMVIGTAFAEWDRDPFAQADGAPKLGDYVITYKACDASNNCAEAKRTVTLIDRQAPKIDLIGPQQITIEARTKDCDYVGEKLDPARCVYEEPTLGKYTGAECHDYVHGDISSGVVITGEDPDYSTPRAEPYTVVYNCMDASGMKAKTVTRNVTVVDTRCPTIELKKNEQCPDTFTCDLEAGFEYKEAGATASDTLDGDISDKVTIDGEVNQDIHWYGLRSCQEIKEEAAKQAQLQGTEIPLNDGEYFISAPSVTTAPQSTLKVSERVKVWCDMANDRDMVTNKLKFPNRKAQTYYVCKGCDHVVPYTADHSTGAREGSCGAVTSTRGTARLQMAWWGTSDEEVFAKGKAMKKFGSASGFFPAPAVPSNDYLCSPPRSPTYGRGQQKVGHDEVVGKLHGSSVAEAGSYILSYHVEDAHGNTETVNNLGDPCPRGDAGSPKRTILVRDTLPPVISLHMLDADGKIGGAIHVSKSDQVGVNGVMNPAGDENENAHLTGAKSMDPLFNPANAVMAELPASIDERTDMGRLTSSPYLMAEQATGGSSSWLVAAGAAAVAGVALLATAARKEQAVATSVPV